MPSAATLRTATRLRLAVSTFTRHARERSRAGDLTGPQLTALSRLDRQGPAATADLARWEQITPQAMGTTVAGLEQRGLVTRDPDGTDRRRSVLALTPDGRAALRSGRGALVDHIATTLAKSFTPEEVALLDASAPLIQRLGELI